MRPVVASLALTFEDVHPRMSTQLLDVTPCLHVNDMKKKLAEKAMANLRPKIHPDNNDDDVIEV